ncbi:glycosyltransferase family 2 protein [Aquifex aeolicus]|uniref:Alginate synthesis-related protein n=1 Tax=Aquifex aeolicus (strain VF5) TaxID=224324 RepID=O67594_AQUAE|nr:glycosyltransferase family 2 protein [Aquifex aeolicus]AAC07558.1 alginate synthesis-related protein [Aquifex aeolicus VF5]
MKPNLAYSSREDFPKSWPQFLLFLFFWLGISFIILALLPGRAWDLKFHGFLAIAAIGVWRYTWFAINALNALIYNFYVYPKYRRILKKVKNPYPRRLYFMIPSYKESPRVSEIVFMSLVQECYKIPSEVYVFVAVGSKKEADFIEQVVRAYDYKEKIKLIFLYQELGKRVAMGHTLRAISRHFTHPLYFHRDYKDDLIVFMDGDTVLGKDVLKKTLPLFKLSPKIAAVTTDEEVHYIGKNFLLLLWYRLKFARRHMMMMSHSLYRKVLTLTGRFSVFRAHVVLNEEFIRFVEADKLEHYLFGKFRFLMGDDKSTWFYLLKNGWDMLYAPDALTWSVEERSGNFFKISISLMFRWYGNMLRNNWRAIKLGPKKIGSWFIWWAIVDQRISMWTSLVGPTGATLLSLFISPFYWVFYAVWVIWIRTLQLTWLFFISRLTPHILHLLLQVYDKWVGSVVKIYASSNLAKQSWAKHAKQEIQAKIHSFKTLRTMLRYGLIVLYITLYVYFVGLYVGVFKLPRFGPLPLPGLAFSAEIKDCKEGLESKIEMALKRGVNEIYIEQGTYCVYRPVKINTSNITLKGKGKVLIISKIKGEDKSVIEVSGSKGKKLGYTLKGVRKGESELLLDREVKGKLNYVWIGAPNTEEFLKSIGSRVWKKEKPFLRQGIYRVEEVRRNRIILSEPVEIDYPPNSVVYAPEFVKNVRIENLTLYQEVPDHDPREVEYVYENLFPGYKVDGIRLRWVSESSLINVKVLMAGSHPLSLENSYGVKVKNFKAFGSWNKGKGGNGYVRIYKSHRIVFVKCYVKGVRHFVIQWASSRNVVKNCTFFVDVNFHGGYSRFNTVKDSEIIIPKGHPWSPVEKTPPDAHWAPPDGEENKVLNTKIILN